jgi:phosphoribosylglycinamide formyltransferase 2
MLLGAGELGKEVIIALQRLGVEVIAVDRYPDAPGHQVAHRHHVVDMTDAKALRAVVERERPHFVVPEIEAIATDELARIETDALAVVIPTARATQLTMNREGIRRLAAEELRLPTSRYSFAASAEELRTAAAALGFPCVVKPVMSSSGKGQSVVRAPEEIGKAWDYAMSAGRVKGGRVIVEEMIAFDYEITLLTVRSLGERGESLTSFCEPVGHVQIHGDYVESWQPQPMTPGALASARDVAKRVTDGLGGRGIFGVELFVRGDQVWFSEVSPRPHDTGMVTMITQVQNEFELHARAILGLPVDTALRSPGASAVVYGALEAKGIAYEGVDEALRVPQTDLRLFGKPEAHDPLLRQAGLAERFEHAFAEPPRQVVLFDRHEELCDSAYPAQRLAVERLDEPRVDDANVDAFVGQQSGCGQAIRQQRAVGDETAVLAPLDHFRLAQFNRRD